MPLKFTQAFTHASNINVSKQVYILVVVIQFLQQSSVITRFQNKNELSYVALAVRYISITVLEDFSDGNYIREILCYVFTIYFMILSIIQLMLMFFINTNNRMIVTFLKIYLVSTFLLMFPYINAVYNLQNTNQIIAFSIFQILTFLVFMLSIKYIGQEILTHNSVQLFNQQALMFDCAIKFIIFIFSQSKSATGKSYFIIILSITYLLIQIFIPVHLDVFLYPARVGFFGVYVILLLIYQNSTLSYKLTNTIARVLVSLMFYLTYYVTHLRMTRVIEKAICMLIVRRQGFHNTERNEQFDIDYFYIPPFYLQLCGLFTFVFYYIIKMVDKIIQLVYPSAQEMSQMILKKIVTEFKFNDKYDGGMLQMQLKQSKNRLIYILYYKNYMKTIDKRLNYIKNQLDNLSHKNFKLSLGFMTIFDYNLVMHYMAKYYRQHYLHMLLLSSRVQSAFQDQIIDLEYLKHLQVITQTLYPTNKYVKLSYSIILVQQLNDTQQAQYQLKAYQQLTINNIFKQNIQFNYKQLQCLFGQTYNFVQQQEEDQIYFQNIGTDLYTKKIIDILTFDVQHNTSHDDFKLINNIWDRLDNQFINLWSLTDYHINLKNYYEFYEDYFNSMKILHSFKRNNNYFLYYTYEYAIKQYFLLEQQNKRLYQTYLLQLEKYQQGMNIPGNDEQFLIVNYDEPTTLYMKEIYGFPVQVTLLNQQFYQLNKIKQYSTQTSSGAAVVVDNQHELKLIKMKQQKLQEKTYNTDNLPTSKKYLYVLFLLSALFLGFVTVFIILINHRVSFGLLNTTNAEYVNDVTNGCNFLFSYKYLLEVSQLYINFQKDVQTQINIANYFEIMQKHIVGQFNLYTEKFKGKIMLETEDTTMLDYSFNTIFDKTKQLINQLIELPSHNMKKLYKQIRQTYRSSILYIIPKVNSINILQTALIEITVILFASPVVFYFLFYNLDYLIWKNTLYMVHVFKSIPSNIRGEITDYFNQIKSIRIKQSIFDNENIFKFLNDVISFKYVQNNQGNLDNMKYMSVIQYNSFTEQQVDGQNVAYNKNVRLKIQTYKNVLHIVSVITLFFINICLIFLTIDQKLYNSIVLQQTQTFYQIQNLTQHMRIKSIKYEYMQSFFEYNDTRLLNAYQDQNITSVSDVFYFLQQHVQKVNIFTDLINVYTKLYYIQNQHQLLENIAYCKYSLQHGSCSQETLGNFIDNVYIPSGFTVDFQNYRNILNSNYSKQLQISMDHAYRYIYDRIINTQIVFPDDQQKQFYLIGKILKQILYKTQLETYGKNVFYVPQQALHQQQYINQIQNLTIDLDQTDLTYIIDYINSLGMQYKKNQSINEVQQENLHLLVQFHEKIFGIQIWLTIILILACIMSLFHSDNYKSMCNYLSVIVSIVIIIFSFIAHNKDFTIGQCYKIISSQNYIFNQINKIDAKVNNLIQTQSYDQSALTEILDQIYQASSTYNFGQSDNAIPINLTQRDLVQKYLSRLILMPLHEQNKKQIINLISNYEENNNEGEMIYQLDQTDSNNQFFTLYQKLAHILQDHIKIIYKILSYYCKIHENSISSALYNNNIFQPIRSALQYKQELLTYLTNQNLSIQHKYEISPQQYSCVSNFYGYSLFNESLNLQNAKFLMQSYEYVHSKVQIFTQYQQLSRGIHNDLSSLEYHYYYGLYMTERYSIFLYVVGSLLFSYQIQYNIKSMLKSYHQIDRFKLGSSKSQINSIIRENNRLQIHDHGVIVYELCRFIMVICILIQLMYMYQNQSQMQMLQKVATLRIQATTMVGKIMCEIPDMQFGCFTQRSLQAYHDDIKGSLQDILFPQHQQFTIETINKVEDPLFFRFVSNLLYRKFSNQQMKSVEIKIPELQFRSNNFLNEYIDYMYNRRFKQKNNESIPLVTYEFLKECQGNSTDLTKMTINEKFIQILKTEQCVEKLQNIIDQSINETKQNTIFLPFIIISCAVILQLIYLILIFINSIQSIKKNLFFKSIINKIPQHIMKRIYQLQYSHRIK